MTDISPNAPEPIDDLKPIDIALAAANSADDKQGRNIVVLDVGDVLAITDFFVVVDAPNRRLVRTLVDDVDTIRGMTGAPR